MNDQTYWTKLATECQRIGIDPRVILAVTGMDKVASAEQLPAVTPELAYVHGALLKAAELGIAPAAFAKAALPLGLLGGLATGAAGLLPGLWSGLKSGIRGEGFGTGFKRPYQQMWGGVKRFFGGAPTDYSKPMAQQQFMGLDPAKQEEYMTGLRDYRTQQQRSQELFKELQSGKAPAPAASPAAAPNAPVVQRSWTDF